MIATGLTLLGFFALASAMPRHAPVLLGRWEKRVQPTVLRVLGWKLLIAALTASLLAKGWPLALVTWFGLIPVAAACVLLGLTYNAWIARGAAMLGVVVIAMGAIG